MRDLHRIQVPIDREAESVIAVLRDSSRPVDDSVRTMLGEIPTSKAGIAARLLTIGARQVREAQREANYGALARSISQDAEEREYEKAAAAHRRRQAAAWADA